MKKNLRTSLMLFACAIIFGCAAKSFAQQPVVPVVGGYASASITDKEVAAAANYAVKAEAKKMHAKIRLVSITSAEQQVVAGINYRVCLNVETTSRGKKDAMPEMVQATVYKNLKQKYSLTGWTRGGTPLSARSWCS